MYQCSQSKGCRAAAGAGAAPGLSQLAHKASIIRAATVNSELVLATHTIALHPDSDLHLGHLCVLGI